MQIDNDVEVNPLYTIYNEILSILILYLLKENSILDHPDRRREAILIILQELESLGYE